jgi:hypothetical protein
VVLKWVSCRLSEKNAVPDLESASAFSAQTRREARIGECWQETSKASE